MMDAMHHLKKFFWRYMNVSSWVILTYPTLTGHYSDRHRHRELTKLQQFIAENGLSQHVLEPTRQKYILDLVITTEEALIVSYLAN